MSENKGRKLLKSLAIFTEIRAGGTSFSNIYNEVDRIARVAERRNFSGPIACWWRSATQSDLVNLTTEIFDETYDELLPF